MKNSKEVRGQPNDGRPATNMNKKLLSIIATILVLALCLSVFPLSASAATTKEWGIDVSQWQGTINWKSVKNAGVDFAIIRCGYGQDKTSQDDPMWEANVKGCVENGIPYGAYFFCYARNVAEAKGEAQHALRLLKGKTLDYPIYYDLEPSSWQGTLSNSTYLAMTKAFCSILEEAGYTVGVYSNYYWFTTKLTDSYFDTIPKWCAQYNSTCDLKRPYGIWQYSDAGVVSGISEKVDLNYCYDSALKTANHPTTTTQTTTTTLAPTTTTTAPTTVATSTTTTTTTSPTTPSVLQHCFVDLDKDGDCNMIDALRLYKIASGSMSYDGNSDDADANGDGSVNMMDVLYLYKCVSGGCAHS